MKKDEDLDYHESQLRMYRRWHQEKNDFGYFENLSFNEIENNIENEKEKVIRIKEAIIPVGLGKSPFTQSWRRK